MNLTRIVNLRPGRTLLRLAVLAQVLWLSAAPSPAQTAEPPAPTVVELARPGTSGGGRATCAPSSPTAR